MGYFETGSGEATGFSSEMSASGEKISPFERSVLRESSRTEKAPEKHDVGSEIRPKPTPLSSKLKKAGLNGYSRSSVEEYVQELNRNNDQLRDSMDKQIQSLSGECVRLRSEGNVLRAQIARLEEQNSRTKEELAIAVRERDETEKRNREIDAQQQDLETVLNCYEIEKEKAEKLETELTELQEKYAVRSSETINSLKAESLRAERAEEELTRIRQEDTMLREELTAEKEEHARLQEELSAERAHSEALAEKLSESNSRSDALEKRFSALETELNDVTERLREAGEAAEKTKAELNRYAEKNEFLSKRIRQLEEELQDQRTKSAPGYGRGGKEESAREKSSVTESLYFQMEQRRQKSTKKQGEYTEQASALEQRGGYRVHREAIGREEQLNTVSELQNAVLILLEEMRKQMDFQDQITNECRENRALISALSRDRSTLLNQNEELLDKADEMTRRIVELEEENANLSLTGGKYEGSYVSTLPPASMDMSPISLEEEFSDTMRRLRQRSARH